MKNNSFKQILIKFSLFFSVLSSIFITIQIKPDAFLAASNGDFSGIGVLLGVLIAHLVVVISIAIFSNKSNSKLADSQLLKPSEVMKEQKRMQNEGIFHVRPKVKKSNNGFYKDKSALQLSRNVKLSTKASYTHTIVFGPTGSGKSAAFFIPILRSMNGNSIIVTDPKGELHAKTKDYLEYNGYEVLHLNFNDPTKSSYYSLLGSCKDHSEVNKLAESIMGNGGGGEDDNWAKMSKPLFAAFLFHEFDKGEKSMSNVIRHMGRVGADPEKLEEFFEFSSAKAKESYLMFKGSMGSDATVGSIFTTINGKIEVFTYEKVQTLSEQSSFSADNFRLGKAALFVSYPEDEAIVYSPYIASFFYQIMSSIKAHPSMYEGASGERGNGVHFLLDEFANIGTLPELDTFLSTIRSKDMSVMLGIQSFDQIKVRYKDRTNTIVENCKTKIVLPGTTGETSKFFSELVGEEEYSAVSTSSSKSSDTSLSQSTQKKMILSQDQIRRMKTHDVIFVSDNLKPVKDIKNLYYLSPFEQNIMSKLPFSNNLNIKIAKFISEKLNMNKEMKAYEEAVLKHAKRKKAKSKKNTEVNNSVIPKTTSEHPTRNKKVNYSPIDEVSQDEAEFLRELEEDSLRKEKEKERKRKLEILKSLEDDV